MFNEVSINLNSEDAEILSEYFLDNDDVLSISIEDKHAGTDLEEPLFGEPNQATNEIDAALWSHSVIKLLLTQDIDIEQLIKEANEIFGDKQLEYTIKAIDDQDWVRLTQSQFDPIKISDSLYIVPTWHQAPNKDATIITLDPGIAFGTGSHPTTFMCLQWLSQNITSTTTLLDYGCGSGILAICAKKLGATTVFGTDIDSQAIESSIANAKQNNVAVKFCLPDQLPDDTQFDIVVANILANPLRMLAPVLRAKTKQHLILSGILDTQAKELSSIYKKHFKHVDIVNIKDEWALLHAYN